MSETNVMIYTAIFQGPQGKLSRSRYLGSPDKASAWLSAAKMGSSNGDLLIGLVSGDHPVYFYENSVQSNADAQRRNNQQSAQQNHDVYEMP